MPVWLENDTPTAMTTSDSFINQLATGVPLRPNTPAPSGLVSGTRPLALKVVSTGAPSRSANASSSARPDRPRGRRRTPAAGAADQLGGGGQVGRWRRPGRPGQPPGDRVIVVAVPRAAQQTLLRSIPRPTAALMGATVLQRAQPPAASRHRDIARLRPSTTTLVTRPSAGNRSSGTRYQDPSPSWVPGAVAGTSRPASIVMSRLSSTRYSPCTVST